MADPDNLVKGNCYFHVGYLDTDLFIPLIETFIFIETMNEDVQSWIFQDAESFANQTVDPEYLSISKSLLHTMLDISEKG